MTKTSRLLGALGLFTFTTLAACANHADEGVTDDDDLDEVGEVANALTDDDQGAELPPAAAAAAAAKAPASCTTTVDTKRELMITNLAVVEDPVRTKWTGSLANASDGAWTFGRLMTNMAGDHEPAAFVERWLHRWEKDRPVNGFSVESRPAFKSAVTDAWPKRADGRIDLTKSPLRLLAVVNRMDLRNLSKGNAGEGRFVFGVLDASGRPMQFTVILEFRLPAKTESDVKEWSRLWHDLGAQKIGSAAYNAALQKVTDKFSGKNAAPGRPNGSAIGQIRTNEIEFGGEWELREFRISSVSGNIYSATVKQTPDLSLRNSKVLGDWINDHEKPLLDGTSWVPQTTAKKPFRAGSAITPIFFAWNPPGVKNEEARHLFSLNTCNGCHAGETSTFFLHVNPRSAGQETSLSGFLTGENVQDPITNRPRTFNDLQRRNDDLRAFLCQ